MHAKVRSHVYEQINVFLFHLDIPPIARKIFPANLMALLVATLFSVARRHQQISYTDVESRVCSFFSYSSDFDRTKLAGDISNYTVVKNWLRAALALFVHMRKLLCLA